jgi:hypothetical protein
VNGHQTRGHTHVPQGRAELTSSKSPSIRDSLGLKRNKPVCERFSQVVRVAPGQWRYSRMNCNSRTCPQCGPMITVRRAYEIENAARRHGLGVILSLTIQRPPGSDPASLLPGLRRTWAKVRVYFWRRYKESMSFIAVVNQSSDGGPQLQVILPQSIDRDWLSRHWINLGGSPLVNVRPIKNLAALARCLTRQLRHPLSPGFPPGTRLVSTSRKIRLPSNGPDSPTLSIFCPLDELRARAGDHVLEDFGHSFVANIGDLPRPDRVL